MNIRFETKLPNRGTLSPQRLGVSQNLYTKTFELIRDPTKKTFKVFYKGIELSKSFRVDFVCYDKIIVELKAVSDFTSEHEAQVYNYLKASSKNSVTLN